jgi:hypothetical protein
VTDLLENFVWKVVLAEPRLHWIKFAMVPALRDACSGVEGISRHNKQVLALACAFGDVVLEVTPTSSDTSIGFAVGVPDQGISVVICTDSVVME